MRVSQAEKSNSRQRIIQSAKEMFKSKGIEKTSVALVMEDAGLTHGGFYRHFDDKQQLVEVAIESSFEEICGTLRNGYEVKTPAKVLDEYSDLYLSKLHLDNPQVGCPIASMASELAKEEETYKTVFSQGFKELIQTLQVGFPESDTENEKNAMRHMAMLVGAMVIARASDAKTAKKVLAACRARH